jgi:membrane-associated protease RseP (regulator of RpoE activity)
MSPAGLRVEKTMGAAAEAGLQAGDTLTHIDGTRVRTFGDLQYYYDQVPRDARRLSLGILRDQLALILDVQLPERWWLTDLNYRHWTVDPLVFFKTQPLSPERKTGLAIPVNGFAGEILERERFRIVATPP